MNGNIMISDLLIITESKKGVMAARDTNTFAWRLRTTRDRAGITQFEMCDRIKRIIQQKEPTFDLSYPAYNKYETGDTATPRLDVPAANAWFRRHFQVWVEANEVKSVSPV